MREANWTWVRVLVVVALATLGGLAACKGGPERLPQCQGKAQPINVPGQATGSAGSDERGQ